MIMTNPIIYDGYVHRAMTQQELAEWQTLCEQIKEQKQIESEFVANQIAVKTSARTKLAALGLTDAEIAAFLGA